MKESQRSKSNQTTDEVKHKLLQNFRRDVGEVDTSDMAALNTITKQQLKNESKGKPFTPGDIIDVTRAVMSDSGADPSLAMKELRERKEGKR